MFLILMLSTMCFVCYVVWLQVLKFVVSHSDVFLSILRERNTKPTVESLEEIALTTAVICRAAVNGTDTHRQTQRHTDTHITDHSGHLPRCCQWYRHTQTDTETDRHRERQRHTDTHITDHSRHLSSCCQWYRHTQTDTETHRHTYHWPQPSSAELLSMVQTHTDRHRDTQTHISLTTAVICRAAVSGTDTHRQTQRHTDTHITDHSRHLPSCCQWYRHTQTDTERQTHRERHTETYHWPQRSSVADDLDIVLRCDWSRLCCGLWLVDVLLWSVIGRCCVVV